MILLVLIIAGLGLWMIFHGWNLVQEINKSHNNLVESIAKIDEKAQTALLTLDHIKLKNPI